MAETDLVGWLTVDQTAARIGCSTRTVERLGRAKRLEQRLRRQDGTPPVAVYNPDDVARIALERQRAPAPFVLPAGTAAAHGNGNGKGRDLAKLHFENATSGDDPIRQVFTLVLRAIQSPPSPPKDVTVSEMAESRLFLTIPEAAAASGLSQAHLRRKCQSGWSGAIKDRGWKIRRKDLEAL